MKKTSTSLLLVLGGFLSTQIHAQVLSTSDYLVAQPIPDRTVSFDYFGTGVSLPVLWGLDTAWAWDVNFIRGSRFMGANNVKVARVSFTPSEPLTDGVSLTSKQITDLNWRLSIVNNYSNPNTKVALNDDHEIVDAWYVGYPARWAQLMDQTTRYVQNTGRTVISVSPFNEPDYGWGQGSNQDFYDICVLLKNNALFNDIRISGGNTLNCDQALNWYNFLKPSGINEGNTHQLAGSFNNFASFYQTVRANGHYATGDEMHNVMEAMVGAEYGMQSGIWWGSAELARGEFCKASDGVRLGYAEHRPNWTAASVYRNPEGKVLAFGGTSERQAATTTYRFLSKNQVVFFDGHGPQHEYTMVLPGGTGYQNGQTNAERVVNVTWGSDIQPVINGRYAIVNRNSGKVMDVTLGSTANSANIWQRTYTGATNQQWDVTPVDSRIGGDFSYFTIKAVHSGKVTDLLNGSLDNGANIMQYEDTKGANQQWYLEYVEDGWFYIRNRQSAYCMEVVDAKTTEGANIQQWVKDEGTNQQWRFLPIDAAIDFVAPASPANLVATANSESIQLDWSASADADVSGYVIFRAESEEGPFNTIARNITTTSFVDNTATTGGPFYYAVKAVDKSLNHSAYSNKTSATSTGAFSQVVHLPFEGETRDKTIHLNHSSTYGSISYVTGKVDAQAISLNGSNAFVQLPANVASQQEISISTWVYWRGVSAWQRIFDFGNGQDEYMFLSPNSGTGQMRFAIKNGGAEQQLNTTALAIGKWNHVAVTMGASGVRLYVNGVLATQSSDILTRPLDFKPVLNYIGRSQFSDPLFNGYIDDFRIYNYELSVSEIEQIVSIVTNSQHKSGLVSGELTIYPVPATDKVQVVYSQESNQLESIILVYNTNGSLVLSQNMQNENEGTLDVSELPEGLYMIKLTNQSETLFQKLIIQR